MAALDCDALVEQSRWLRGAGPTAPGGHTRTLAWRPRPQRTDLAAAEKIRKSGGARAGMGSARGESGIDAGTSCLTYRYGWDLSKNLLAMRAGARSWCAVSPRGALFAGRSRLVLDVQSGACGRSAVSAAVSTTSSMAVAVTMW